jgi:hypothetical protein
VRSIAEAQPTPSDHAPHGLGITLLAVVLTFTGCSSNVQTSPTAASCDPRLPARGSEHTVPNPAGAGSCKAVLLMCNYCKYNADGSFKESGSQICGACAGWDTK